MGQRLASLMVCTVATLWGGAVWAACSIDTVELRTVQGTVQRFSVELVDDPDERAKGLMFRQSMPKAAGMLFVFPEPKHATFWMKDTPLSLDIIFADETGRVTRVHEHAVPMSQALIDGGLGVAFALEINAGLASPMGIAPGTVLRHPAIAPDLALWPCDAP